MTTPAQLPLNQAQSVTLDGSGNGTVRMSPDGPNEHWQPVAASVSASTGAPIVNEAQCKIYAGPSATQQYFIDGTLSGSTGDSTTNIGGYDIARTRTPYVWAVWSGGDPGASATLVLQGTVTIG